MVFSSITFIYYFLPICLFLYFLVSKKRRNIILLFASLFFYFYGEPRYIIVLLFSIVFNYYLGKKIENTKTSKRKQWLILNLIINFGILFYFKYFHFFLDNINYVFHTSLSWTKIILPIGISFFTFQATSYVIDIYRKKVKSAKSLLDFATYLSLFPQLVAGPIVRYETINKELENRKITFDSFAKGIKRFIIGLSKKVLLANILGELINSLTTLSEQSLLSYWLQFISNTLQIYFDFSGYSDMAIGLGLMLGFHFLENFNYPLVARSITDFWHRWHISLSSWFKDYIYIPLGGNRGTTFQKYRNIFIVWLLTGLWHGASWNFICWGLYFACLLIIEKVFLKQALDKHPLCSHLYTLFLVMISFIIFNANNMKEAITFIQNLFAFQKLPFTTLETTYYFKNFFIVIIISILASFPIIKIFKTVKASVLVKKIFSFLEPIAYLLLLLLVTSYIINDSFNPFLYFRF